MSENIKLDPLKKDNQKNQSPSESESKGYLQPNIIQRMQALPDDEKPDYFKPNAIQRMQADPNNTYFQPNIIQRMQALPDNEKPAYFQPNAIQRLQALPENERPEGLRPNLIQRLQRKQAEENEASQLNSEPSKKMPEAVQTKMENSFNADFSDVNIHEGDNASKVNAHAYTQGNNIHFAPGQYNPESKQGQELLGHELTHVVQQSEGRVQPTVQKKGVAVNDDKGLEKEADEMGKLAAEGKIGKVIGISNLGIQKKENENLNKTLFDLETTGASDTTAGQDKLSEKGVKASEAIAEKDFTKISNYATIFLEVGTKYGIPPALLAAIASRESRGGVALDDNGYGKYDKNGYGLMQIDTKHGNKDADDHGSTSKEHVDMAAKHFKEGWDAVKEKHKTWEPAWQLRGAVAAYNFGVKNVQTKEGLDKGSTGNDYSSDIWARARFYSLKKEFGADSLLTDAENASAKKLGPVALQYKLYEDGKIDMIALGKALIPLASANGKDVLDVFSKLGFTSRDNLAFAMAKHSSDSQLASFDKTVLKEMASQLGGVLNTFSWGDNEIQEERINKILNPIQTSQPSNTSTPAATAIDPVKSQKELSDHFKAQTNYKSDLPQLFGSRTVYNQYLKETKLSAAVGAGGVNKAEDVALTVQALKLKGIECTAEQNSLIAGIKDFQKTFLNNPDGNISPSGGTATKLGLSSGNLSIGRIERKRNASNEYHYDDLGTNEVDYNKKLDLIEKNIGLKSGSEEEQLVKSARMAAGDSQFFDDFTKGIDAKLDWESEFNPVKEKEGHSLSSILQNRMERFHKYCVAAGIYKGNMIVTDAVRGQKTAHKWSGEHFIGFNDTYKTTIKNNLIDMYNNSQYRDEDNVKDLDGNIWAKKEHFIIEEGSDKATDVNYNKVKEHAQELDYRSNPSSVAAEGYLSGDNRKPLPTSGSPGQSLHITGNAIDINSNGFIAKNDGIIDLVALNFGVVRCANNEQWHFECTDKRVSTSEKQVFDLEKR